MSEHFASKLKIISDRLQAEVNKWPSALPTSTKLEGRIRLTLDELVPLFPSRDQKMYHDIMRGVDVRTLYRRKHVWESLSRMRRRIKFLTKNESFLVFEAALAATGYKARPVGEYRDEALTFWAPFSHEFLRFIDHVIEDSVPTKRRAAQRRT